MKSSRAAALALSILFTWLNTLLVLGTAFSVSDYLSFNSILGLTIAVVMVLPLRNIYRNIEDLDTGLMNFIDENRVELAVTCLIFVPSALSFSQGYRFPFSNLVNLSFHTSAQLFLPVRNLYTNLVSAEIGSLVFQYARLYLHFLWIYLFTGLAVDLGRKTVSYLNSESENSINADTIPFKGGDEGDIKAEVYVVTGMHGLVRIPESFCKECHLFIRAVQKASEEVDADVDIQVKSYWTRFLRPLLKGGHHPPVLLVDGELFSQGYDVPDKEELVEKFRN